MTTPASGRKLTSACNGVTVDFPCPVFRSSADLKVYLLNNATDANSAGTLLSEGADYALSGSGPAGTAKITTMTVYPAGKFIRRWRQTSRAQGVGIAANAGLPASTQEGAFDRLSLVDEELDDDLARTIRVPLGEAIGAIPAKAARVGKFAAWDAGGEFIGAGGTGADAGLRADLAASSGAALAGFAPVWAGAITRTVQDKLRDLPHLYDIILPANRATAYDATTALNAALATGEQFVLPQDEVRFAGTLVAAVNNGGFIGQGRGSILAPTSAAGDIFLLGDGASEISGLIFRDFRIWPTLAKTGGYAFNGRMVTDSEWQSVRAGSIDDFTANGHRLYDGYYFDRFSQNVVVGGELVVAHNPVKARGNVDQSFGAELLFDGGLRIYGASQPAFLFGGGTGGVYLGRLDTSVCGGGVRFDKSLTAITNRECFISDLATLDSHTGPAIETVLDGLETLDFDGWISACGAAAVPGVIILSPTSVNVSKGRIQRCPYDGVKVDGGAWTQSGGLIRSNGTGVNGGHGIAFVSGRLNIAGTMIHANGSGARGLGASIDPAADNYAIEGNSFFGNGQRAITGGAAVSASKVIRNNLGHVTDASGTATIVNGTSSLVINHGLADAPTYVSIGWAGAPDAAILYAAPADFTATQLTVRTNANVTTNRDVWWRAVRS